MDKYLSILSSCREGGGDILLWHKAWDKKKRHVARSH